MDYWGVFKIYSFFMQFSFMLQNLSFPTSKRYGYKKRILSWLSLDNNFLLKVDLDKLFIVYSCWQAISNLILFRIELVFARLQSHLPKRNVEKKVIRSRNIASIEVNKNKLFKNWMQIRDKTSLTSFYPFFYLW